jgi:hypothetical protein
MKAWEDISSNEWNRTFRTLESDWFIDHGVKIEKFDDGRIVVLNTMTASDFHEPITPDQQHLFDNAGWLAGCYKVNVDSCTNKMNIIENMIRLSALQPELYEYDRLIKRREKLLKKRSEFTLKLEKVLQSL